MHSWSPIHFLQGAGEPNTRSSLSAHTAPGNVFLSRPLQLAPIVPRPTDHKQRFWEIEVSMKFWKTDIYMGEKSSWETNGQEVPIRDQPLLVREPPGTYHLLRSPTSPAAQGFFPSLKGWRKPDRGTEARAHVSNKSVNKLRSLELQALATGFFTLLQKER